MEMQRFLSFCQGLPAGTDLRPAMEGYGRFLKSNEPPLADWRLEQAREALRCFQKGIENWAILPPDEAGNVEVRFRARTREGGPDEAGGSLPKEPALAPSGQEGMGKADADWLRLAEGAMRVRRMARRTVETYLGWMRRYLQWAEERDGRAQRRGEAEQVQAFLTWLALERQVSAATQNQALSALLFLTQQVMGAAVEGLDAVRAKVTRHLPVVLTRKPPPACLALRAA